MKETFIPLYYPNESYAHEPLSVLDRQWFKDMANIRVGPARLRQVRMKNGKILVFTNDWLWNCYLCSALHKSGFIGSLLILTFGIAHHSKHMLQTRPMTEYDILLRSVSTLLLMPLVRYDPSLSILVYKTLSPLDYCQPSLSVSTLAYSSWWINRCGDSRHRHNHLDYLSAASANCLAAVVFDFQHILCSTLTALGISILP
jgi:hypothetical protein